MNVAPRPSELPVAVVTGATSGIGRAAARRFLAAGWRVAATGRDVDALAALAAEAPDRVRTLRADLLEDDAITALARSVAASEDQVDALVNAAGVIASDALAGLDRRAFERMFALNVTAPVLLAQALLPWLEARKGAVVNVSSVTGVRAFPGVFSYCVSKAALDQATRCAALELAPRGVRVNAVNPGVVVTELHKRGGMDETQYAAFLERAKTTHPLGRPGLADEVAEAIYFLATPASSFITGVTLPVDGGRAETCAR
ncbi:MAG TPA: SDR family oxidoreductase [Planctomycetota bacterium]|nr:SDR family oxidoreductase [Planctomycetota bacterium]